MENGKTLFVRTRNNLIWPEDNVIWVKPYVDDDFDTEEVQKCIESYQRLIPEGEKWYNVLDYSAHTPGFSKEARKMAVNGMKQHFKAVAVINNSFMLRLLVNFCYTVYSGETMIKMVRNEEAARKWLRSLDRS